MRSLATLATLLLGLAVVFWAPAAKADCPHGTKFVHPHCNVEPPGTTLGDLSCNTDEIARFNGSEWVCDNLLATKTVFVSSTDSDGDLNGLQGADDTCQLFADNAIPIALTGKYKAWLSDDSSWAISRISHSLGPYVLVDGTAIASGFLGLVSGMIQHKINLDENGALIADSDGVWTGTFLSGLPKANDNCNGWVDGSSEAGGFLGTVGQTGEAWTGHFSDPCNISNRLYCFQQ